MSKLKACYLFKKTPLPQDIGSEIQHELTQLQKMPSKEHYLRGAYDIITARHISGRLGTFLRAHELFSRGAEDLWRRSGFMHCTNQNYLLALLLVKGGHFDESDIRLRWTFVNYLSPHQYLMVKISADQWVNVDCWGRYYGISYGNYAHGFNTTPLKSFVE